jgi:glycosyltransferase involved in cell wall biosynthesis
LLPWLFVRQFVHLLWFLPAAKLCVVQFGGWHALLPGILCKLFGKPYLIITGGTDTRRVPEIGYGNFNKPLLGRVTAMGYKLATAIAPVHQSLSLDSFSYLPGPPQAQGIYHFVPDLKTPSYTIYNGFELDKFIATLPPAERKPRTYITVAGDLSTPTKNMLKGIDILMEAASLLPHVHITIVGKEKPDSSPSNITWIKWVNPSELPTLLSQHRFYLQLSVTEGFPNALCEGMLCACVPIATNVASMPFIVGETGYILRERSPRKLSDLMQQAENSYQQEKGVLARERIVRFFPISKRDERLLTLCRALVAQDLPDPQKWEEELNLLP